MLKDCYKKGIITALSLGVVVLLSCVSPSTNVSHNGPAIANASTTVTKNVANPALVNKGKAIFTEKCELCHQKNGKGAPGLAPSLTSKELLSVASNRFFKTTITKGRPGTAMVAFKDIDVNAVIAYLRSFSKLPYRGDEIDNGQIALGHAEHGRVTFRHICENCHGVDGIGYEAGGNGTAIGKAGFLDVATDAFIRAGLQSGRSNTQMRGMTGSLGLANLSRQDIEDVITYLRTLPRKG